MFDTQRSMIEQRSVNEFNRRVSAASQESMNVNAVFSRGGQLTSSAPGSLRKSYSDVEAIKERQKMNEGQPKKKYFKRFDKIFRPIIGEDETLYNCYSCALYQDSIASGHLYLTFNWFCFYSNFIGRQRQVAINVNKIQSITQERTAKIIPNAIKITTDTECYVFSSFISRDRAYKTLVAVWHQSEEPTISGEESDLSDVESMTRIVAICNYADRVGTAQPRSESDSTSETSIPELELDSSLAQDCNSNDVIVFTAPTAESPPPESAEPTQATLNAPPPDEKPRSNLECKQWVLWSKVESSFVCMQNLIKWCRYQSSVDLGVNHFVYNVLIFAIMALVLSTLYLAVRTFLFEQDQIAYAIRRELRVHDINMQRQSEAILTLNHKLLSQMSDMLTTIQKLLVQTKTQCMSTSHQ